MRPHENVSLYWLAIDLSAWFWLPLVRDEILGEPVDRPVSQRSQNQVPAHAHSAALSAEHSCELAGGAAGHSASCSVPSTHAQGIRSYRILAQN